MLGYRCEVFVKQKIDFQVLLLSICWHDVWISKRIPKNLIHLTFHQIVEGLGSALIFKKYALKAKLNKKLLRSVYYAIRKHSSFQVIPPFTLEAKILIDLDKLELWNNYRFFNSKLSMVSNKEFYQKYLVRFYYFYSSKVGLYFKALDKNFRRKMNTFWKEIY